MFHAELIQTEIDKCVRCAHAVCMPCLKAVGRRPPARGQGRAHRLKPQGRPSSYRYVCKACKGVHPLRGLQGELPQRRRYNGSIRGRPRGYREEAGVAFYSFVHIEARP